MSTDRDTTRIVRSWLRTDENDSADRVLGAVLDRLDTTPQRRATSWPAWRFPPMNTMAKLGVAAVAVAVALLGYTFLLSPNVGGPGPADPSATFSSTPAEASASTPSARTYRIDAPFPVRITLDVPDGWRSWASTADVHGLVVDNAMGEGNSGWGPAFWIVENVYADPCDSGSPLDPQLGPSVDDLVAALAGLPGYEATAPTPVTVGGFDGVEFELTAPEYGDDCGAHRTWSTPSFTRSMFPGETNRIQVIDVDGVRLVLAIVEYAYTTEYEQSLGIPFDADAHVADQPELREILASMRIESRP